MSPQGDGGVPADQPTHLHLQQLPELSRGGSAGGLAAVSRGRIAGCDSLALVNIARDIDDPIR